jgi:hypothetical protein
LLTFATPGDAVRLSAHVEAWGYNNLSFQPKTVLKVQAILAQRNALGICAIDSIHPEGAV